MCSEFYSNRFKRERERVENPKNHDSGFRLHLMNHALHCINTFVLSFFTLFVGLISTRKPINRSFRLQFIKINLFSQNIQLNSEIEMSNTPFVQLSDGNRMPALGLGTCASNGSEIEKAVKDAIDVGYRHIDTAWAYENEYSIGKAVRGKIAEGVVKRSDMFIVTKLWNTFHEPHRVERACRQSLDNLQLEYIDLYLIHFPFGYVHKNDHEQWPRNADGSRALSNVDYIDTWKAMERLVELGWVKSIGVSNFNSEQIARLLTVAKIPPVVNQVECSPTINQKKLTKFCKDRNITITGFCPLGHPNPAMRTPSYMYDDRVKAIADKYNKTPAQIGLRYLHELGVTPIPKSVRKQRMTENISIFDFSLNGEEKQIMSAFNTGDRLVGMYDARKSPYWPYGIKF